MSDLVVHDPPWEVSRCSTVGGPSGIHPTGVQRSIIQVCHERPVYLFARSPASSDDLLRNYVNIYTGMTKKIVSKFAFYPTLIYIETCWKFQCPGCPFQCGYELTIVCLYHIRFTHLQLNTKHYSLT